MSRLRWTAGIHDLDGDDLTYEWRQISGPTELLAASSNAEVLEVTPDAQGIYEFSLRVSDGSLTSDPDFVRLTASFVADIQRLRPMRVKTKKLNLVRWFWSTGLAPAIRTITPSLTNGSKFAGPLHVIEDPSATQFEFTAELAGAYQFSLVVNDGLLVSVTDSVTVIVLAPEPTEFPSGPPAPASGCGCNAHRPDSRSSPTAFAGALLLVILMRRRAGRPARGQPN